MHGTAGGQGDCRRKRRALQQYLGSTFLFSLQLHTFNCRTLTFNDIPKTLGVELTGAAIRNWSAIWMCRRDMELGFSKESKGEILRSDI